MSGIVEHALRKLAEHAREWAGLGEIDVPSAAVADDDTAVWGDFMYLRGLMDDILHVASVTPGSSPQLADMLDRSTITQWDEYHDALSVWPDPAGELLRQWQIESDDEDVAA